MECCFRDVLLPPMFLYTLSCWRDSGYWEVSLVHVSYRWGTWLIPHAEPSEKQIEACRRTNLFDWSNKCVRLSFTYRTLQSTSATLWASAPTHLNFSRRESWTSPPLRLLSTFHPSVTNAHPFGSLVPTPKESHFKKYCTILPEKLRKFKQCRTAVLGWQIPQVLGTIRYISTESDRPR